MEEVKQLARVRVWNRYDGSAARLVGFEIRVGNSPSIYANPACATGVSFEPARTPHFIDVQCAASGRFLFIVVLFHEQLGYIIT